MPDDRVKVEGHRRAIREHIQKYKDYPYPQDKEFALKTIYRVQDQIEKLKAKDSRIESSWEDNWSPN